VYGAGMHVTLQKCHSKEKHSMTRTDNHEIKDRLTCVKVKNCFSYSVFKFHLYFLSFGTNFHGRRNINYNDFKLLKLRPPSGKLEEATKQWLPTLKAAGSSGISMGLTRNTRLFNFKACLHGGRVLCPSSWEIHLFICFRKCIEVFTCIYLDRVNAYPGHPVYLPKAPF